MLELTSTQHNDDVYICHTTQPTWLLFCGQDNTVSLKKQASYCLTSED